MKKHYLITLWILLTTKIFAAGGASSGGGDLLAPDHDAAWFLGNDTIQYCVDINDSFSLLKEDVIQDIKNAFSQWKDYIELKNINRESELPQINTNFKYIGDCNNHANADVYFYVGVLNEKVNKVMPYYTNPLAFTYKETYDFQKGRGKGFVWFREVAEVYGMEQSWKHNNAFYGMVLHEIGHVLGNGHVEGTIMTENVANLIFAPRSIFNSYAIDHYVELADNREYIIEPQFGILDISKIQSQKTFKLLTGTTSTAELTSQLNATTQDNYISLALTAGEISFNCTIAMTPNTATFPPVTQKSFKKIWIDNNTETMHQDHISTNAVSINGIMTCQNGKRFLAQLDYNMMSIPFEIESDNPDINYSENYANNHVSIYFFDDEFKKRRIFGSSAFWFFGMSRQ